MAHPALSPRPITLAALDLAPRALWLMLIGVVLLAGAWVAPMPALAIVLIVPALVFVILAVLVKALSLRHIRAEAAFYDTIAEFVANDAAPSLTADRDGANNDGVDGENPASRRSFSRFIDPCVANGEERLRRQSN